MERKWNIHTRIFQMHSSRFCILYWSKSVFIRMQLCFCEPCHTTGTTQNRALYYLCLNFVNCSCQQRLQIEVLNFNNICIVFVEFILEIQRGLLKHDWFSQTNPSIHPPSSPSRLQHLRDALKLPLDRYAYHELGKVLERESLVE